MNKGIKAIADFIDNYGNGEREEIMKAYESKKNFSLRLKENDGKDKDERG